MNRAILGRLAEPVDAQLSTSGWADRAIDVETTFTDFDGRHVHAGLAAERRTEQVTVPNFTGGGSINLVDTTETVKVHTEWMAELADRGWVAVDTSAGTFVFDLVWHETGADVRRAELDVHGFVEMARGADVPAEFWMVADEDALGPAVKYHARATSQNAEGANIGIGFEYGWEGHRLKGVLYSSAYVAVWPQNASWAPETFAAWIGDQVFPHTSLPEPDEEEDEQGSLGGFGR